ncbi:tryptophan halogenase family protein [Cellvibrio sp.]|uniref:tryptophan halogenase family protein n=1 Tax=Cellvibrio sp. TaxID=1965322 RepID=UPI00396483EC
MVSKHINSVVIVGGGTAGWMTAASLSKAFAHLPISFLLVEFPTIGTVGVGEATIPTIREFYQKLGMHDIDVMRATNATCKLGIEFQNWNSIGSSFFHPFALYGQSVRGVPFHHYCMKLRASGYKADISEFSLGVQLAKSGKFTFPSENPPSTMSVFDWALHFDAALFADYLKDFSIKNGVKHVADKVVSVNLRADDGFIESLSLERGEKINGDLFIDCSGFQGLLIEGALKTGYEDWSQWLLCDRAVAVQSESHEIPLPYTVSIAEKAGWRWKIPLQHRAGNGHVYSSNHISDDEATDCLVKNIDGKLLNNPRIIKFTPGRRKKAWNKNCIAVGLSSGFLEPLESTSIALIELAIDKIRLFFPDMSFNEDVVTEFNYRTQVEYERVRDFVIFHYKASNRTDSEFWTYCRAMSVPDELSYKNRLFKSRGHLVKYPHEIFQASSWTSIYNGYNYLPDNYDPQADYFSNAYLLNVFEEMRASVKSTVEQSQSHNEFLNYISGIDP